MMFSKCCLNSTRYVYNTVTVVNLPSLLVNILCALNVLLKHVIVHSAS